MACDYPTMRNDAPMALASSMPCHFTHERTHLHGED